MLLWRRKKAGIEAPAVLPYADGLPSYYKVSLGAKIICVCAAATASSCAVAIAYSFASPVLVLAPWLYTAAEVVFAAVSYFRWRRFNSIQHDAHQTARNATFAATAAERFDFVAAALARGGPTEVAAFLQLWFHDSPVGKIGRGNLLELLAYAFFYSDSSASVVTQGYGPQLEQMADRLEALLHSSSSTTSITSTSLADKTTPGSAASPTDLSPTSSSPSGSPQPQPPPQPQACLPPGRNPRLRFMAHMHEPLPHFYRPLAFYAAMEALAWVNHCMLLGAGFRRVAAADTTTAAAAELVAKEAKGGPAGLGLGRLDMGICGCKEDHYYYVANMPAAERGGAAGGGQACHRASSSSPPEVPIVFLHGVGMGLLPYLRLLVALAATGAPVIAFELKHVSQRWTSAEPPSLQQLAEDVVSALRRHGYSRAAVLAHSFGTAVASILMQSHPGVVQHVTMLDPICFQMYTPRLLRNFIYRRLGATGAAATAHAAATAAAAAAAAASATAAMAAAPAAAAVAATAAAAAAAVADVGPSGSAALPGCGGGGCLMPPSAATPAVDASSDGCDPNSSTNSSANSGNASTSSSDGGNGGGGVLAAAGSLLRTLAGLPLDLLMLGPARELHCTALLCRRVVWSEVNLWEHAVPKSCTVVLSGRDDLMCARSLEQWLRDHTRASVVVHPELLHAQICMAWTRQDQILDRMLRDVYGKRDNGCGGGGVAEALAVAEAKAAPTTAAAVVIEGAAAAAELLPSSGSSPSSPSSSPPSPAALRGTWPHFLHADGTAATAAGDLQPYNKANVYRSSSLLHGGRCKPRQAADTSAKAEADEDWRRRWSRHEAAEEEEEAAESDVELMLGGQAGGMRRRCGGRGGGSGCRSRRNASGAVRPLPWGRKDEGDEGDGYVDGGFAEGGSYGGGEAPLAVQQRAQRVRQHPPVVRHDSAGSYLRMQSAEGLGSDSSDGSGSEGSE
ncbi:hypothetical protein Agub_g10586 [Astrephomene gubernaculifera]|uniref:AB hydrolase-1 domain-containing protein n=1 Tax=Astrephomene gubernaculifera TaxID=47775 RepID=A0AAD3DVB9_9CHLO|nr:hypothetical protein Agub_g10586 [Astrephomene gubernaculifera]